MPSRKNAAPKKKAGKPVPKKAAKKAASKKSASPARGASSGATPARSVAAAPASRPVVLTTSAGGNSQPRPAAAARPLSAGQAATAQQAEERRKAATRKLFARIRSLEAIVGADLRKRGSLLLSQAVDQWYAEATSGTASDVSITNAARAVISQL